MSGSIRAGLSRKRSVHSKWRLTVGLSENQAFPGTASCLRADCVRTLSDFEMADAAL